MKSEVILIDKPADWTSFDVVAKIRSQIRRGYLEKDEKPTKKQLRVGHAGTLDPFATGLLIVLLGDACKKAGEFLRLDKTYEFSAKLGEVSTTGDPEGEITQIADRRLGTEEIEAALTQFTGEIWQTPPAFSAIKVNGKRAYKLAREGKEVVIPPRRITIHRLQIIEYSYPYLKCVCDVSSGTYIRSLVEDIGKTLGTGAYCTELRRTRIGDFYLNQARTVESYMQEVATELVI